MFIPPRLLTFLISPGSNLQTMLLILDDEYTRASDIRNRFLRLSELMVITNIRRELLKYNAIPPNGLSIHCGITENTRCVIKCIEPLPEDIANYVTLLWCASYIKEDL